MDDTYYGSDRRRAILMLFAEVGVWIALGAKVEFSVAFILPAFLICATVLILLRGKREEHGATEFWSSFAATNGGAVERNISVTSTDPLLLSFGTRKFIEFRSDVRDSIGSMSVSEYACTQLTGASRYGTRTRTVRALLVGTAVDASLPHAIIDFVPETRFFWTHIKGPNWGLSLVPLSTQFDGKCRLLVAEGTQDEARRIFSDAVLAALLARLGERRDIDRIESFGGNVYVNFQIVNHTSDAIFTNLALARELSRIIAG